MRQVSSKSLLLKTCYLRNSYTRTFFSIVKEEIPNKGRSSVHFKDRNDVTVSADKETKDKINSPNAHQVVRTEEMTQEEKMPGGSDNQFPVAPPRRKKGSQKGLAKVTIHDLDETSHRGPEVVSNNMQLTETSTYM